MYIIYIKQLTKLKMSYDSIKCKYNVEYNVKLSIIHW